MPFTGIVEEIGTIVSLDMCAATALSWAGPSTTPEASQVGAQGCVVVVRCATVLEGAALGCSIAVNGVCLTATSLEPAGTFTVGLAPET